MPSASKVLAVAASISQASAVFQGFNSGATFTSGAIKQQSDFEAEFKAALALPGTNGAFNSARIYTMVQGDTDDQPIAAIPAAIATKTSLLLGLWASAGDVAFANEIGALKKSIQQYCDQGYGKLVAGISVGSEDLYRNSPMGIEAGSDPGLDPDTLVGYVKQVRNTIQGTCLSGASIGHVDTWTAFANSSNDAVIESVDWLGMDAYPYFETTKSNGIENAKSLLQAGLDNTKGNAHGKPVWITETGWPVSGKVSGDAVANVKNAETYWQEVGCPNFGKINMWWYTLQDAMPSTPNPSFGILTDLNGKPAYDLSCKDVSVSSSASASATASSTGKGKMASTAATTMATATMSSGSKSASGSASSATSGDSTGSASSAATTPTGSSSSGSGSSSSGSSGSGSGSSTGSGSGSGSGTGSSGATAASSTPTTHPSSQGSTTQLNSLGAAAVALLLAITVL